MKVFEVYQNSVENSAVNVHTEVEGWLYYFLLDYYDIGCEAARAIDKWSMHAADGDDYVTNDLTIICKGHENIPVNTIGNMTYTN